MKKYLLVTGFAAISTLIISGCILTTGQITFTQPIDAGYMTDSTIYKKSLDLNVNSDYADNLDKIKSVDAVSFVAKIFNRGTVDNKAELYISLDSDLNDADSIRAKAIKVLSSPTVPAGDSVFIKWNDSFKYMFNKTDLEHYVLDHGQFVVYGIADNTPFNDSIQAEIVVTITVGN
jgi:hypothetical protein